MSSSGTLAMPVQSGSSSQAQNALPSMNDLVAQIIATDDAAALNQTLKNLAPKDVRETILSSKLANGQDPLMELDAERNTIGCLYILSARLQLTQQQAPGMEVIEDFCRRFNPAHARLAPDRVTALAKGIVRVAQKPENPKYALGPLYNLVTRYPPTPSHLTTIHPIFVQQCVATRHYSAALPVLSKPITMIDLTLSELSYNDNLVYHYAGGVALGALKRWREAEEFLEICASSPAQVPAAVQLEASKKLVLIQLILYGKTNPPPKYTNPTLQRLLKASPYGTYIKMYPQKRKTLTSLLHRDSDLYHNEKNVGLIQQTIDRAPRWLIKKLTATYLTLSLADIAQEVEIETEDEVRDIILDMIDSDDISASISADGTVTFSDPLPHISKEDVDRMLKQAQQQSKMLLEMERALNANKDYLTKAVKHKDEAGWGPDDDMFSSSRGESGWVEELTF